jgi:hypothetical protein
MGTPMPPTPPATGPTSGTSSAGAPMLSLPGNPATAGGASSTAGTPVPELVEIDRTRGKLPDSVVDLLLKGGSTTGMAFLYPYDQTVFPGGILPPLLQWRASTSGAEGIYVHVHSKAFDYREVFAGTTNAALELPDDAWQAAAAQSQGASDPTTVELTILSGSTVSGPISQRWIFARGQLKSAVYYNTYNSARVVPNNGAVMRILPRDREPEVVKTVQGGIVPLGPCYSCHSLSANGRMLVAQRHQYPGGPYKSDSFDVVANPGVDPPALASSSAGNEDWGFSALFPDGSKLLTAGQPGSTNQLFAAFPFAVQNNPAMLGPRASTLLDAKTGAVLSSSGLVDYAMMPSFAPDGSKVVFNDYDRGQGHSLSIMDFDTASNTFSNPTQIFRHATLYPGWPFFTPDGNRVVFALGDGSDFATVQDPPAGLKLNRSDLYVVDAATPADAVPLDLANGSLRSARDQHLNYYPTVSPVAAGGYFWVFFTSRRSYGNVMVQPELDSTTKKIWVAALDIDGSATDPSHPAFYLPGQELASGNIRAFATLSPCHADGASCTTGIDCCNGFCVDGKCGPPVTGCSSFEDRCTTAADCCNGLMCIGGFCASVVK